MLHRGKKAKELFFVALRHFCFIVVFVLFIPTLEKKDANHKCVRERLNVHLVQLVADFVPRCPCFNAPLLVCG